jgi:predicted small lipoprotein YifL
MQARSITLALAAALSLLCGCAETKGPLWGPNSPRNGAQQPVDPVYGTPIPGYPAVNGCG